MAEGLNRGAALARGEWLFFCHDDVCVLTRNPNEVLLDAMCKTDMFGPCGTIRLTSGNWYDAGRPYIYGHVVARDLGRPGKYELQLFGLSQSSVQLGAQALDGLWIACQRRLFDALQGFDASCYSGFVGYDVDFSFRAALAGARVGIACDLTLFHDSNVGEFSAEKMQSWEQAQSRFRKQLGRHLNSQPGERTHTTIPLERQLDSLDIIVAGRRKMLSRRAGRASNYGRSWRWWPSKAS